MTNSLSRDFADVVVFFFGLVLVVYGIEERNLTQVGIGALLLRSLYSDVNPEVRQ
jgi:Na+/H+ antiporter NhaD/arsenite permease-like protein